MSGPQYSLCQMNGLQFMAKVFILFSSWNPTKSRWLSSTYVCNEHEYWHRHECAVTNGCLLIFNRLHQIVYYSHFSYSNHQKFPMTQNSGVFACHFVSSVFQQMHSLLWRIPFDWSASPFLSIIPMNLPTIKYREFHIHCRRQLSRCLFTLHWFPIILAAPAHNQHCQLASVDVQFHRAKY